MGKSSESFNKKEVRNSKEKKRKEKAKKKIERKDSTKKSSLDDMIAYVDENGMITSTPPDPEKKKSVLSANIEISTPKKINSYEVEPVRKGIVSFFNDSKGFGFIIDRETEERIFVHINNLLEPIKEGNEVVFELGMGQKGRIAINVKVFKAPPAPPVPPVPGPIEK